MLRQLDSALASRVKAYAKLHDLSVSAAAAQLLAIALDHLDARVRAGQARQAGTTQAERSESGRAAVTARWDRVRAEESKDR